MSYHSLPPGPITLSSSRDELRRALLNRSLAINNNPSNTAEVHRYCVSYLQAMLSYLELPGEVFTKDKDRTIEGNQTEKQVAIISGLDVVLYGEISQGDDISTLQNSMSEQVLERSIRSNKHYAFAFASSNSCDLAISFMKVSHPASSLFHDRSNNYDDEAAIKSALLTCFRREA